MIRLSIPEIGQEELDAIRKVLDSGYLVQGENIKTFESLVADYLGVEHAIAVSNGTAALHLALLSLELEPGDEIIVPDFTFPATSNTGEVTGMMTRFADVLPDTLCIDPSCIPSLISSRTKCIIPVHEFGNAADMDRIMDIARKNNLKVIEDAACALGTTFKGRKVGTIGDIGCFSLHPRKAITTGEGGIVTTNDSVLAERIRVLRNHGISVKDGKVSFILPGLNYRLTDIQGAMGVQQMKRLPSIIANRKRLASVYDALLSPLIPAVTLPVAAPGCDHVYQTYHIILADSIDRNRVISALRNQGIETNYGAYAVHGQPYYTEKYHYPASEFPNSVRAFNQGLALPLHGAMTEQDVETVVSTLRAVING